MESDEPKGCLFAILRLFGIGQSGHPSASSRGAERLPYRRRDDFLSPAELSFYRVLLNSLGGKATVCCKVNLADVVHVATREKHQHFKNKIDRKHVDFLLCDSATMQPLVSVASAASLSG